jgi:hypothetical protein
MPRRLTKEQIDYIKVHINDYPRKEVAKAAGVTLHTLYKYITILGGTKIDNKLSKETISQISVMYQTMTAREISEVLNIPQSTILGQVSKLGLKHNVETINRIRKERNKSLRDYWNKERYASKGRKPHLEIYIDELQASHGTTTGSLDKEQLLYLQSRGISKDKAYEMLLSAFENKIVDNIKDEIIKEFVQNYKRDKYV